MKFIAPPVLQPGDRVEVVAPSGPFDRASFESGLRVVEQLGLVPVLGEHVFARTGYLAGDDRARADDLVRAVRNRDTRAVFCARGGYGAMRLLPALASDDAFSVALKDKLLVGFSDATALHALWGARGAASLHGPVVTSLARVGDASRQHLRRALFEPNGLGRLTCASPRAIAGGRARGPVFGGNLSVLTRLVGTPFWPSLRGAIVFLEDVGERPYRIDRMVTHLRMAGALDGVAGFLLGDFTRCEEPRAEAGDPSAEDVLAERLGDLGVPVLSGFPSGHGDECFPLLLGAHAELDADAGHLHFEEGLRAR